MPGTVASSRPSRLRARAGRSPKTRTRLSVSVPTYLPIYRICCTLNLRQKLFSISQLCSSCGLECVQVLLTKLPAGCARHACCLIDFALLLQPTFQDIHAFQHVLWPLKIPVTCSEVRRAGNRQQHSSCGLARGGCCGASGQRAAPEGFSCCPEEHEAGREGLPQDQA